MWAGRGPRWVIRNIYNEYPAVMRVPVPVRRRVQLDQLNKEVIIISSPMRLGRGGRARLARLAMNHQVVMRGSSTCKPRARIIVRLWVRS